MTIITRTLCGSEKLRQHVTNTPTIRHNWIFAENSGYFEWLDKDVAVSIYNGKYDVRVFYYTGEHKEIKGRMVPIYHERS